MTEKTATGLGLLLLSIVLAVLIFTDVPLVSGLVALLCAGALGFGLVLLARRSGPQ